MKVLQFVSYESLYDLITDTTIINYISLRSKRFRG